MEETCRYRLITSVYSFECYIFCCRIWLKISIKVSLILFCTMCPVLFRKYIKALVMDKQHGNSSGTETSDTLQTKTIDRL